MPFEDFSPILRQLRAHLKRCPLGSRPVLPAYRSLDQALANTQGYEDSDVIRVVSRKTEILRNALSKGKDVATVADRQTVQNMFVLSYIWANKPINVIDVGGACGATFFLLNQLLPGRIGSWHVVETPAMTAAGRELFTGGELAFFDDLEQAIVDCPSLDLLVASGVLQYLPCPLEALDGWLKTGARFVYLTRTPLGLGLDCALYTRQVVDLANHGPGVLPDGFVNKKTSQPMTVVPYEQLIARLERGWIAEFVFAEGEDHLCVGSQVVQMKTMGFLMRKPGSRQDI